MNRKKVLFVISNLGGGGAEKVAVLLLEYLDRERFEPCLVLHQDILDYEVPEDVPIICLDKKRWYDFPRLIWRLSRVYKNWRPDIVLSFMTYPNIIAVMAQKLSHASSRLLLSEHALYFPCPGIARKPLSLLFGKWLPRWLYPCTDKVICVSQGVADSMRTEFRIPPDKIAVIYNPVDIKRISELSQEKVDHHWFTDKKLPVVISMGRLSYLKGYPYLLRAFAQVSTKFPGHLVILGQGEEEQALKELTKELGIEDRVAFLGFQENPFKYIAHADLFVLASLQESFGMVITEAMACGTPVLSTNCPTGPGETITDNVNGLLIPQADETALAEAMLRLLNDKELATKLAQAGRKRAEDFAVEKIVKQYEDLFE